MNIVKTPSMISQLIHRSEAIKDTGIATTIEQSIKLLAENNDLSPDVKAK